jgi:tripartite-type tricarboxylate transporter receptor subunit TctC
MFHSIFKVLIPALVLAATPWIVKAQDYPLKQAVSIIVPFPAGSGTDTIVRIMAGELQKSMGGTFVVENRPGYVGIIGTEQAAKAPPDGYTLVVSSGAQHTLARWLFKNVPYDAVNDFAHIGKWVDVGFMLVVNPALPVKSLQEFIAYAKANPGKLAYGYGTSSAQLGATLLNSMAKIDTLGVPYKGQPPALTDLIGGSLQFMFVDLVMGTPLVTSGQLRAIAVTPAARVAYAPTLPTIAESGFPDYDFSTWVGLAAPRATPRPIVERLNAEVRKILAKPEVRTKLEAMGMDLRPNSVAEQEAFVQATLVKFGRIVKDAGILPQ